MNAPTKRVEKYINEGLLCYQYGISASYQDAIMYQDVGEELKVDPACYILSFHNEFGMPAWKSQTFETVQELANAMQKLADLRTWKIANEEA